MSMQSPRNLREWQQAVERKLASGKQGTRIAISHANDKADEVRGEVDDFKALTPTAPIELSVQTATYIDANRKRRGSVTIDFPDVVLSTNGAPVVINNYELQGQDQADTSKPFLTLSTSDISSVYAADLPAGSTWKFRVRANGGSTILPGEWSATVQTVIAADTTPPPQPSTPVATAVSGGVKVTWDGLAAGGGSMPGDFDRVELAFGMSASPTTVIDTYYSASFTIQPKTSYNTTHYFRLRAFDSSGNASAWSAQATAIPTPLVDVDVIISKIDAATTEITNIGRAAILDGAINSLKLADGAVSLIKIQDQIISLGKLDTAANAKIQKGIDDAFAAQSTANTASGNANTAISNAAAADSKAGAAQTAADKAQAVVDARIAAGVNLNVNGDFDAMPISSPPLGWPTRSLTTVQASTTTARSGTNVLKATPTTNSAYAYTDYFASAQARTFYVEYWCRLDQAVIAGNENLNLGAFFVQQDAAGTVAGAVAVYTNGTSYPGVKLSDLSTTAWTKFAVTWTTTQANNVKLRVGPRLPAGTTTSNSFEVDGFRVIDITESKAALDAAATAQAKADLAFTNAGTAFTNAGLAQTSADGKNNVMYLAALPSTTAWADGDTVFIRTAPGAPITAQWKWVKTGPTTGSWSQETLGHQVLASIDLGKATIGELNGIYVKAFSLSADTLKIGSGANLFPDPKMIDTAGWPVPAGVTLDAVGTGKNGQGSVLIAASSSQVGSYYAISDATKRITVAPNSSYRLSIWVRAAQVIPAGGVAFYARQYPVDGSAFSFTTPSLVTNDVNTVGGDGTIPANTWTLMSGVITTGATLSTLVVGPHKQTSMTGAVRFSDPAVEVMGIGRLIVDGTIQGNHVATNSITAKHMTITDLTNFAPSLAESPTDYTLTNQMSIVTSGLDPSGWRFHVTDATSESRAYGPYMAVSPGENLWMGANLYRGSGTISAYLRYYFYDSNKALIAGGSGTQYIGVPQLSTSPSGTRMEGGAVVPAGAAYTRWTLIVAAGTGSTGFYNIQGRRRLAAELIVDGTISSNAIATNAVTAKQILVGDFQNLAIGSDFEDATAVPWALQPTHTITTAQKKSGTSSLRLAATTGTQKSTFTNDMRVKEGEQWYFKLHAYIDATFNGTGAGSKLRVATQSGAQVQTIDFTTIPRSAWTTVPLEMTYTVPAGATSLVVELWSDNTVGTAYIDDIQIRRVSEASLIMNLGVEKLTATSASMNQATIDKLWTDVVHSRRITTDMLVVGRGVNAIVDEFFDAADLKAIRDTEAGGWGNWGRNGTTNLNWYGATLTPGTARTFYYDVDAVAGYDKNSFLPVETGQVWRFVASYQSVVSGPRLGVRFIRKDNTTGTYTGSLIKALDGTSNVYAPAGNGVTVARTVEIPSDWSHISPFIQFDSTCTSAYVYGGATFTNMATSSLVVDGAITARNLTVDDTMWVNIIKFKKIGGGEIDANNIVADTGTIGILRGGILINDAVTTGILKADAITSKHTITGAAFQTTATTLRGVKIDATNGLRQWDSNGNLLFNIGGAAGPNLMVGDLMTSRLNTPGVRLVNSSYWGLPAIVYSYAGGNGVAEASTFMRYSVNNDPEMVHRAPDRSLVGGTGPGFVRIEGDLVLSLGLNSNQNMRSEQPFVLSAWSPADGYHSMTLTSKLCNINTTGGNIQLLSGSFYTQAPGIYNKTTGNAANMWITTDGGMFRSTSASKYKIDPQEMELAPTLLDVPVKNWIDKAAAEEFSDFFAKPQPWTESDSKRFDAISLKRIPGVIAEDVRDAGGEDFVVYGEDGEIEGLMYDRLAVAQIQLLKEMVESLTKRVAELETYTSR